MTSYEFVIWLKGFTEACNDYHPTPKQWDRLKEVLNEVEDYEENTGLDLEIDDFEPEDPPYNPSYTGSPIVWNPGTTSGTIHGSGYYTSTTLHKTTPEEIKKQLLD
jgi:hypothetical protein